MEKKNTGLIIIIVVLAVLLLGVSGYLVYDKVTNKKEIATNFDINNKEKINTYEDLPKWATYLINQDIKDIIIYNRKGEFSEEEITKDQLISILKEMTKSQLIVNKNDCPGGGMGEPLLYINLNDNEYFSLYSFSSIVTNNERINDLLKKETKTVYDLNCGNAGDEYWYAWKPSYIDTLFE